MVILIPCRLNSSRLPNKPLVEISGLPSIWYTVSACCDTGHRTVLVADDQRIIDAVKDLPAEGVLVPDETENGTERCSLYAQRYGDDDHYMIVAGDEVCVTASLLEAFEDQVGGEPMEAEPLATVLCPYPRYSFASLTPDGYVEEITRHYRKNTYEATGIYYYDHWNLERYAMIAGGHEIELNRMLDAGAECYAYLSLEHPGFSLNTPSDIRTIEQWING